MFYTFYMLGVFILILPFLQIFDAMTPYLILLILYVVLLYSIYTDFEVFIRFSEMFLIYKTIEKKDISKFDMEFVVIVKEYMTWILNLFNLKFYSRTMAILDFIFILVGLLCITIFVLLLLNMFNNVL